MMYPVIPEKNVVSVHEIQSHGLTVAMVKITPALAEHLVNFLPENQRCLKANLIERLTSDMKSGWWSDRNGSTIVFDKNGNLIDGQHRLRSILRSGVTINSLVVFGADSKDIETIDAGLGRSMSDVFKIAGIQNYANVAAMTSNIMSVKKHGVINSCPPTRKAALDFALKNNDKLQKSHRMGCKAKIWLPISVAGYLHFMYSEGSEVGADSVLREFAHPKNERSNAIQVLKDVTTKVKNASMGRRQIGGLGKYWINAISIKAFNYYFVCQDVSLLRHTKQQKYPKICSTWL